MTTVGYNEQMTEHTTTKVRKVRAPNKPKLPIHEQPVSFARLDITQVQDFVGRVAQGVEIHGEWVVIDFGNCTVRFKQWTDI